MENLQNRHDLTNEQWDMIEPVITQLIGRWGGSNANDHRVFVKGCFWMIRTGSPWCDLPPQSGRFNAVHRRYKRWGDKGIWDAILLIQ